MDGYTVSAVPSGTSPFGSNPKLDFPAFGSKSAADELLDYVGRLGDHRATVGYFKLESGPLLAYQFVKSESREITSPA